MKTVRDPGFGAGAESTRRGRAAQLCAARRKVRPSVRTHTRNADGNRFGAPPVSALPTTGD
jgi:hypothetical protein